MHKKLETAKCKLVAFKKCLKNATNRCERQSKEKPQTTKIVCVRAKFNQIINNKL